MKLGSKGAIVADESSMYEIPPYSVKVIDNIGAGDAFAAGFCVAYWKKGIFLHAVRWVQ